MGSLILLPFARYLEEETEEPMVATMAFVALGMYLHALIFWRQFAAMAILTFYFRFIRERRLLPFLATVLLAMTFHKVAVVFLPLYWLYRLPINRWLLLALLWVVTLLSCWLLDHKMEDPKVRIPFLMVLIGATIQPLCFTLFWWLRVVLFFRVALVTMIAHLYAELFGQKDNKAMALLKRYTPRLYGRILPLYEKRWFRVVAHCSCLRCCLCGTPVNWTEQCIPWHRFDQVLRRNYYVRLFNCRRRPLWRRICP